MLLPFAPHLCSPATRMPPQILPTGVTRVALSSLSLPNCNIVIYKVYHLYYLLNEFTSIEK